MADPSMEEQWGLKPAPPPPGNGQPPSAPAPTQPAPLELSIRQQWGTQPIAGQTRSTATTDEGERFTVPHAMDTGPPPVPQGPLTQTTVDDAREWDRSKEEETFAFRKGPAKSVIDYTDLPDKFSLENHPEYQKFINAQQMVANIADAKERAEGDRMVKAFGARLQKDVAVRNKQAEQARREQLARDDAPFQLPEARHKTQEAVATGVQKQMEKTFLRAQSGDAKEKRQADFDLNVSPLTTMSVPKPGTDQTQPPNAENRDYTPLIRGATDLMVHNRDLKDGMQAAEYLIRMGTFAGGTGLDANAKGFNGRTGAGAAHYKVIGRDAMDNVIVQMNDGMRLRVPPQTYRMILDSRQQSTQRARAWQEKYDKSQEPGMFRRGVNRLMDLVPKQGF